MHNFRELQVWKRSIKLVKAIYQLTSEYPMDEKFGLISQLRRCAISIPSNIAEGSSRKTNKDFSNFLAMSLGSQFELETQLILSNELSFISDNEMSNTISELNEIQKMTRTLKTKFS